MEDNCKAYRGDDGAQRGRDYLEGTPCAQCGGTPRCDRDRAHQAKTHWPHGMEDMRLKLEAAKAKEPVRAAEPMRDLLAPARSGHPVPGRDQISKWDRIGPIGNGLADFLNGGKCGRCDGLDSFCAALRRHHAALDDPDAYEAATGLLAAGALHPDHGHHAVTGDALGGVLGVDIGGRVDATALARVVVTGDRMVAVHTMELPNRASRDDIGYDQWSADQIVAQARDFRSKLGGRELWVVLDETGPGRTIAATVKRSLACTSNVRVILASITSGDEPKYRHDVWSLPKKTLMDALEVAMRKPEGDLDARLAFLPGGAVDKFRRQLASVESKELPSGHERIESKGHDDLVLAVALAVHAGDRAAGRRDSIVAHNPAKARQVGSAGHMYGMSDARSRRIDQLAQAEARLGDGVQASGSVADKLALKISGPASCRHR